MQKLLSFILFPPDVYVYIAWGVLLLLTAGVWLLCRRRSKHPRRRKWLRWLPMVPVALGWFAFLWGTYIEFGQLEVVRVDFASSDLPDAFDGYRIVQFSDAHVGTYTGCRSDILRRAVDSINAQHADVVVFTGDLQNKEPEEIAAQKAQLSRIKARDGIFSVLGNHDYTMYTDLDDPIDIGRNQGNTEGFQLDLGWQLLKNSHRYIRRDSSRIVIAGMENDGEPGGRFPQKGDVNAALSGVRRSDFVVMLEHDPTCWRRKILPHCHAQLTLSGHTHGGQLQLMGWSLASLRYREVEGMYYAGPRALYVSKGLGGVVPFRLGAKPEIVVITLHKK